MKIKMPHRFKPYPYQQEFFDAFESGDYNRFVLVRHRRSWKDKTVFNAIHSKILTEVGIYYYFLPTYKQGRKVIWDAIDNDWFKLLHHIPKALIKSINNTEMKIEYINGSILQIIGTDDIDRIVGTNPKWVVYSEYPLQNPLAWQYIRPILRANGWRAIRVYTPRWKNRWYELYEVAKQQDDWFVSHKTVEDTTKRDWETPILTATDIEKEREEWMDEGLIQQEYYVSFDAAIVWAVYGDQIRKMEDEGRVCSVPYEEWLPVYTFWDIGIRDKTSIWFAQFYGKEIRLIDFYENFGKWYEHYIDIVRQKWYSYDKHYLPHDTAHTEQSTGVTKVDRFKSMWLTKVSVVPRTKIEDWLNKTRAIFKNMWFDKEKTADWLNCIKSYHYKYNENTQSWSKEPEHDWSSHASDALRYLAVMYDKMTKQQQPQKAIVVDQSKYL